MATNDLTEETLRTERLLEGKLLTVYRDDVRLPDGTTSVREYIRHPGAAAVVPLFEDGTTVLVRQFRYPPRQVYLEVPAGKFDAPDEAPEEVAARELEEETGWKAARFTALGVAHPCIGYSDEVIHFFLADGLTEGERNLQEGEHMDVVRLPLGEAIDMARRGALLDMKTVTALLYADRHLRGAGG